MRPVAIWLERFRRSAGVPAAATDDLTPELSPVFAALDEIDEEARAVREATELEVARRLDEAERDAEQSLARWRRRAELERARAEAAERDAIVRAAHVVELDAEAEAERLRARGRERIPALVERVVACIRESAG